MSLEDIIKAVKAMRDDGQTTHDIAIKLGIHRDLVIDVTRGIFDQFL